MPVRGRAFAGFCAAVFAAVALLLAAPGDRASSAAICSPLTGSPNGLDARGVSPAAPNPLAGLRFFVDPTERSAVDYRHYLAKHQRGKAAQMRQLAQVPKFRWFGKFTGFDQLRNFLAGA